MWLLAALTIYLCASIITVPFAGRVWFGEIPPLALFQLPKLTFAHWLRTDVVMKVIHVLGISRGSYSPDHMAARPYGLLLAYMIPGVLLLLFLKVTKQLRGRTRRWAAILAIVAAIDYIVVLFFGNNGYSGFTMY